MATNGEHGGSDGPRQDVLNDVVRRGERLRRRRRVIAGLGGSIALLLVAAGVAVVVNGDDEPSRLASGGSTTTTSRPATVSIPTTTTTPAGPGVTTATTTPTSTVPADPESTAPVSTTTTTTVADTLPAAAQPRCTLGVLELTLGLAAEAYHRGQPVVAQAVLRNKSAAPCYYASYTAEEEFKDAGGSPVTPGRALIADAFADTAFGPGQTLTATPTWDQRLCVVDPSCPLAPFGTYSVTARWSFDGPPIEATLNFMLVP